MQCYIKGIGFGFSVLYLVALSSALENVQEQWKDRFSSVLKEIEDMPRPSVWENKGILKC